MALTDAQIAQIAEKMFLLRPQAKLPKPIATTGAASLATKLDPIGSDAKFKDFGIGVIDFTEDVKTPKIWLHNQDDSWRIGSTTKIAILLAAAQLRDDVRQVQELKLVSTPGDFDQLFRMPKLWQKSKEAKIRAIAENAPRISSILDLTKTPVDFLGPDPDTPNKTDLTSRLGGGGLTWEAQPATDSAPARPGAAAFTFSERLWLTGARSDDVAADSCSGDIGLAYLKAIQRAYGLYDDGRKKGMLLAGPFAHTPKDPKKAPTFRPLAGIEMSLVKDAIKSKTGLFDDQRSWVAGSAAALTAYMIALIKDELIDSDHTSTRGAQGCKTIRSNLSGGKSGIETQSFIAQGVKEVATVSKEMTKIGLLATDVGEPAPLDSEFAYLEATSSAGRALKFAVVAIGLRKGSATPDLSLTNIIKDLGVGIFRALSSP